MHSSSFSPGSSTSSGSTRIARGGWAGERGRGSRRVASRTLGCDARPPVARSRRRPETFSPWNKRASRDRPDGTRVSRAESALPALFPQAPSLSTVILRARLRARTVAPPPPPPPRGPAMSRPLAARARLPPARPRASPRRAPLSASSSRGPRARVSATGRRGGGPPGAPLRAYAPTRPGSSSMDHDDHGASAAEGPAGEPRALVRRDRAAAPARVRERQERRSPRRTAQDRARVRAGSRRPRRRRSRRRARARGGAARARPRRGAQDPRLRRRRHRCVGSTGPGGPGGGTRDAGTRGSPASTPPPRLETRGPERFRSPRHASRFFREPSGDPFPEIPFANNSQKLSKTLLVRRLTTPPSS